MPTGNVARDVMVVLVKEGEIVSIPLSQAESYFKQGYKLATPVQWDHYEQAKQKEHEIRE